MFRIAQCSIFLVAVLWVSALLAAPPMPGDKVHVQWAASKIEAEVVSVNPRSGWVKVKFNQNGLTLTPVLPPDKVFADAGALEQKLASDDEEKLELLRTNSDGKNVSTDEPYAWHAPGRNGQKQGPLLFTARVKAARVGVPWFILEERQGEKTKEHVLKIEQISNTDRKYLFDLIRKKR
jgi:hypothetical protein